MCFAVNCKNFRSILTWDKPDDDTVKERRKLAGCGSNNKCNKVNIGKPLNRGPGYPSCDEYPFASTSEADAGGQMSRCVPQPQNSSKFCDLEELSCFIRTMLIHILQLGQGSALRNQVYSKFRAEGKSLGRFKVEFTNFNIPGVNYCLSGSSCKNDGYEIRNGAVAPDGTLAKREAEEENKKKYEKEEKNEQRQLFRFYETKSGATLASTGFYAVGDEYERILDAGEKVPAGFTSREADDDVYIADEIVAELDTFTLQRLGNATAGAYSMGGRNSTMGGHEMGKGNLTMSDNSMEKGNSTMEKYPMEKGDKSKDEESMKDGGSCKSKHEKEKGKSGKGEYSAEEEDKHSKHEDGSEKEKHSKDKNGMNEDKHSKGDDGSYEDKHEDKHSKGKDDANKDKHSEGDDKSDDYKDSKGNDDAKKDKHSENHDSDEDKHSDGKDGSYKDKHSKNDGSDKDEHSKGKYNSDEEKHSNDKDAAHKDKDEHSKGKYDAGNDKYSKDDNSNKNHDSKGSNDDAYEDKQSEGEEASKKDEDMDEKDSAMDEYLTENEDEHLTTYEYSTDAEDPMMKEDWNMDDYYMDGYESWLEETGDEDAMEEY